MFEFASLLSHKPLTKRSEGKATKWEQIKFELSLHSNRASANTHTKVLVGEIVQAHFPIPLHLFEFASLSSHKVLAEFAKQMKMKMKN